MKKIIAKTLIKTNKYFKITKKLQNPSLKQTNILNMTKKKKYNV